MGIHITTASLGLVLIVIGIGGAGVISERSSWVKGTATVQRVTTQCEMTATERQIVTKTKYSATIDCDGVELFELVNADKTWRVNRVYIGDLRVEHDGKFTTAKLALRATKDHAPTRGDTFPVLQDPNDPQKLALIDGLTANPLFAGAIGLAGVILCWLGFGRPGLRRRDRHDGFEPPPEVAPAPAVPPRHVYQSSVTDYSRARISQSVVSAPRKAFGRRGAQ